MLASVTIAHQFMEKRSIPTISQVGWATPLPTRNAQTAPRETVGRFFCACARPVASRRYHKPCRVGNLLPTRNAQNRPTGSHRAVFLGGAVPGRLLCGHQMWTGHLTRADRWYGMASLIGQGFASVGFFAYFRMYIACPFTILS